MRTLMTEAAHPGAIPGCPDCGGKGFVAAKKGSVVVSELCTCVGTTVRPPGPKCPICRDSGWSIPEGTRSRMPCACQQNRRWREAFDQILIPARHLDSTLKTFRVMGGAQAEAVDRLVKWINAWERGGENRGFVLWGEVGRGKTHLMCGALRALLLRHGVRSRFVEFSHMVSHLKYRLYDQRESMEAVLAPLVDIEVLAIDELGKGRVTDFELSVIDELVSRRYNAGRTILATTNYEPTRATGSETGNASQGKASRPTLPDRVQERVYSRLNETCEFWQLDGMDWRATYGKASLRRNA